MILKLIEKKSEVPGVETFIFQPVGKIQWLPGQFLHYVLHHRPTDDRGSDRWFTVASAPFEEVIKITTRFDGEKLSSFKKKLKALDIGDSIEVSEVEGDFIVEDPTKDYVFIAGGIGVTPFRSILKQLEHDGQPINVALLYVSRDQNVVFKEEFENIAEKNPNFKIHYVFSPERIEENKIKELIPDLNKPIFYISGPEPMVESVAKILSDLGVGEDRIKQDWFPGYMEV